ncbi:MAG: dehydrogenase [Rubrivivax sp.]|nr:dehydrogenase [Rubrivivax sp.]MBK8527381.1 dehydrogenase [Rubrivivax sp.]
MPYMLLIVEPLDQRSERGEAAGREAYQQMLDFGSALQQRGVLMNSSALAHSREGVRLQMRDGRRSVVDGPFAESKEMVGGFFLVDVPTREQALAIAAECPAAHWSTVEVRETGVCYESS